MPFNIIEFLGDYFLDFLEYIFLEFGDSKEYKERVKRELYKS